MKSNILVAAMVLAFAPAWAQAEIVVDSESTSGSQVDIGIGVVNGGGTGGGKIRYGTQKIKNTPGVILGGFSNSFSSDYCGGTAQAGVSVAGFGGSAGAPVFDDTCKILRSIEKTANLAQQAMQVSPDRATMLMRATDLMMCKAVPGVTDVALKQAGIDCGDSEQPESQQRAEWQPKAFGQP